MKPADVSARPPVTRATTAASPTASPQPAPATIAKDSLAVSRQPEAPFEQRHPDLARHLENGNTAALGVGALLTICTAFIGLMGLGEGGLLGALETGGTMAAFSLLLCGAAWLVGFAMPKTHPG